jgi:hypothetical protein
MDYQKFSITIARRPPNLREKEQGKATVDATMGAPLHRADGSATATANGYTVVGAVNGPLEVQRRDELPEEAAIEVNIRPATGVASMYFFTSILSSCWIRHAIMKLY